MGANTGAKRPPNSLHILLRSQPTQGETEGRMHRTTKVKSQRGPEEREGKEDERQARKQQQSSNRKLAGTDRKWNTQRGVIFPQREGAAT